MTQARHGPTLTHAFVAAATATWVLLGANLFAYPLLAALSTAGLSQPLVLGANAVLAEAGILFAVVVAMVVGRLRTGPALGLAVAPRLAPTVWSLVAVAGGGVVLDELTFAIARTLPSAVSERLAAAGAVMASATPGEAAIMLVPLALAPALCEEALCRGVILRGLSARFGGRSFWPIAISSLFFGLLHVDPLHVTVAALMGVLFGVIAVRTGSLWPPVLGHLLNNVVSIVTPVLGGPGLVEVLRDGHEWWLVVAGAAAFAAGITGLVRSTAARPAAASSGGVAERGSEDQEQDRRADAHDGEED